MTHPLNVAAPWRTPADPLGLSALRGCGSLFLIRRTLELCCNERDLEIPNHPGSVKSAAQCRQSPAVHSACQSIPAHNRRVRHG